ncbi:hypothetical protein [Streptomyces sp. UNOB3_S3]|uniref:hypothetical protein n=1 Tax=Streptomyces sp. UNOB3_S3 TaxID=2871682 RepID=UPI001E5326AA|nr:hypothetical protein [Streptomyces sp. UNOB3_S3]MCC3775863.1 hypothetical protein [Streptomyces sp. UNOB3_S3]
MIRTIVRRSSARRRALVAGAALLATLVPMTTAEAAKPSNSDLEVVRIDPDAAAPGGTTEVRGFVANQGPETTASPFIVDVTLPDGVTAEAPFFPEECKVLANGRRVRCPFPAGLAAYDSATANIPVRLATTVPVGVLTGGRVEVRSPDDKNQANDQQPFTINVVPAF